jgi:hypothetical protein
MQIKDKNTEIPKKKNTIWSPISISFFFLMLKGQNSSYLIAVNISKPVSLFIYLFIF